MRLSPDEIKELQAQAFSVKVHGQRLPAEIRGWQNEVASVWAHTDRGDVFVGTRAWLELEESEGQIII
jgi:hypothetical protein